MSISQLFVCFGKQQIVNNINKILITCIKDKKNSNRKVILRKK